MRPEWVLAVGILDFTLETSVVAPALPLISRTYDAGPNEVVWIFTAFGLAAAVATPLAGRLGDRIGRRRVLLWSLIAFALGSAICAVASSLGTLILGRVVQGLGTGTVPLALALVRDHVEPNRVSRAVGILIGAAGAGSVLGELGGSALVDVGSLGALFWTLSAFSIVAFAAVALVVPESAQRGATSIDWTGGVLLAAGLVPIVLALSQGSDWGWGSTRVLGLLGGAGVALALFAARQGTAREPLFDPALLARRPMWSAQVLSLLVGFVAFSHLAVLPLLAGLPQSTGFGLGLSTFEVGLALVPSSVTALISGPLSARLVPYIGTRALIVGGLLCIAVGNAILVVFPVTVWTIVLSDIPLGLSFGMTIGATLDLCLAAARSDETGAALGMTNELRTIGSALGASIATTVLVAAGEAAPGVPALSGFDDAFLFFAVASLLTALFVPLVPPGAPKHTAVEV